MRPTINGNWREIYTVIGEVEVDNEVVSRRLLAAHELAKAQGDEKALRQAAAAAVPITPIVAPAPEATPAPAPALTPPPAVAQPPTS